MKKKPKFEDFKVGCIFFVPFKKDNKGVFGYIKYDPAERPNPRSLGFHLADIYDRVCRIDQWSEEIKNGPIKIYDIFFSPGYFYKNRYNQNPMILTNHYTDIIHPVKFGFFKTGSELYWYDADEKNVIAPDDESQYRQVEIVFPPYDINYIEAIFNGKNIKYGDPISDAE